jgi:hypothetical protein
MVLTWPRLPEDDLIDDTKGALEGWKLEIFQN